MQGVFIDILYFTGAINQLMNGNGNININISDADPVTGLLGGNNSGITTTFGGGVNYNDIIGNKIDFQSNYFYSRYNPVKESHIHRQYFLPANPVCNRLIMATLLNGQIFIVQQFMNYISAG